MPTTIRIEHRYAASPDAVWEVATDFVCFQEAMKGLAVFRGLPEEPLRQGMIIDAEVSLLGLLPWARWTMEVREFDPVGRFFKTHEYGGSVTRWDHHLRVAPSDGGAALIDEIEIEAGAGTWIAARWGRYMYRRRHKPRLRMLGLEAGG